jgi:nucleoside-diphosphate-sugar epimerase
MNDPLTTPVVIGAGPVGRAVVAALVARGHEPTVVTRSATSIDGARSVAADVSDPAQAAAAIAGATVVFQCAQPAYHRWPQEFPALQSSILAACEQAGAALIATENTYGYGDVRSPLTPDMPMQPCSEKGRVRAEMWAELEAADAAGRVRTAAVRASDFFGPAVEGSAFGSRSFDAVRAGKKAEVMLSGETLHSVTFVHDLAEALVIVAADPTAWGRAWHAPTAPAITQRALVELAARVAGTGSTARVVPMWQIRLLGLFVKEVKEMVELAYEFEHDHIIDSGEFEHRFSAEPTPLEVSLAATLGTGSA